MKLVFKKDNDNQIRVFENIDGTENNFSYIVMIKSLIESGAMEEPEIQDGFSDAEASSIKRMVNLINNKVANLTTQEPNN